MMKKPEKIVPWKQVKPRIGLGRVTVYKMIREGKFPAPVKIGALKVGWRESEIDRWIGGLERVVLHGQEEPVQTTASEESDRFAAD
jgi:prophage regulatory protein